MIEELTGDVLTLAQYMSKLSEEAYAASWMDGLEYALWKAVLDGPRKYGHLNINAEIIRVLKELSSTVNGWVYFDDQIEESFINIKNWEALHHENIEKYSGKVN